MPEEDDNHDALQVPGGLEVAEMKESLELKERREQMKQKIQESADMDGGSDSEGGALFESEGGFLSLLQEANLSPRHLKFCCGGLLLLGLMVGLIFGVSRFFFVDGDFKWPIFNGGGKDSEPEEVLIPEEDSGEPSTALRGDPSLDAAFLLSDFDLGLDPALGIGEDLSEPIVNGGQYLTFVLELEEHVESLEVDVNELLNRSTERRRTLEDYRRELGFLEERNLRNIDSLNLQIDYLFERLSAVEEESATLENRFFELSAELDAYGSSGVLQSFIESSQRAVELRATLAANEDLLRQYRVVVEISQRRRLDIELNAEALVKGVKVVEVEGSDLDLVIQEAEL